MADASEPPQGNWAKVGGSAAEPAPSVGVSRVFRVLVLNQISAKGLKRFPAESFISGPDVAEPDAVLVRSADMHHLDLPASVKAIGRAGAGINNIPVPAM